MKLRACGLLIPRLLICALSVSCTGALPASQRDSRQPAKPRSTAEPHDEFAINRNPLRTPLVNPRIVISKSKRRLMLYSNNELVRTYRVGLGTDPVNDKVKEGDRRTPEGNFYVFTKNEHSAYYLSLGLSYPNVEDAERGLRDGLIDREQYAEIVTAIRNKSIPPQGTALGGEIYIHGNGSQSDWTWGCVALDDKDIRELFNAVPVKTPVLIEH
jgi:lipoprotein-anchoring transpeptidase ErfK/SrfK